MLDWAILRDCLAVIPRGLPLTLGLIALSAPLAFMLAIGLVIMRRSANRAMSAGARAYAALFRGTPLLVQLFLFYYGSGNIDFIRRSPLLWWLFADGFRVAVLVLALNSAAYLSEILIGGFKAVPPGLRAAAAALGMTKRTAFFAVELPLAWRQALPACGNELILSVKATGLASTIAVMEMMSQAKRLFSSTFAPLEVFIACACFYLMINFVLVCGIFAAEHYFMRHTRRG
ncbi:ABC transporter permease subunit [Candidatus Tokpelaia sp.]|uniref:ABC transporter permease subunit n=1 Tax=Candidatus Tokpelaia sp. TaxID=2233777 RepID=UPI00123C672E|nr:ABC transporter permease subunit [Candidatus Tokpelaia sp.]KAA6405196.1 ABC transporter permease [Candidatus Tokpelaia sp.]